MISHRHRAWVGRILVFANALFAMQVAGQGSSEYDYSTPEAAFFSLQKAIRNRDAEGLARGFWLDVGPAIKEQGELFWSGYEFLKEVEIVRVERIPAGRDFVTDIARVWWRHVPAKKIGYSSFGLKDGRWLYGGRGDGGEGEYVGPDYNFTTPLEAFQSIRRACNMEVRDIWCLYNVTSAGLRGDLSFPDYEHLAGQRIQDRYVWGDTYIRFNYDPDQLEVETLGSQSGKELARVWRLDQDGKRTTYELFVKEGDEWKWVPDKTRIWYPAKPDQKAAE